MSIEGADGRVLARGAPESLTPFVLQPWLRLAPGRSASSFVQWSPQNCGKPDGPYRLAVRLPRDTTTSALSYDGFAAGCDGGGPGIYGDVQADGFVAFPPDPTAAPGLPTPLAQLSFFVIPPPTVSAAAGSTVQYEIEGLDPTMSQTIALSPCIGYLETLVDSTTNATVNSQMYTLNCNAYPVLEPGSSVLYDMRVDVPAGLAPGTQLDLIWTDCLGFEIDSGLTITVDG